MSVQSLTRVYKLSALKRFCIHQSPYQSGSTTVEMAITMGFFLIIFLSFIISVFLMYTNSAAAYLAREGVYYALKRGSEMATDTLRADADGSQDPFATQNGIKSYLESKGLLSPIGVVTCWKDMESDNSICDNLTPGINNKPGDMVQVTVTYSFTPPLINSIWPRSITLKPATSRAIIQF